MSSAGMRCKGSAAVPRGWLAILSLLGTCVVTNAGAAAPEHRVEAHVVRQQRDGFFPLWTDVRPGTPEEAQVFAAQTQRQLAELWDELDLQVGLPTLDWSRWLVLALRRRVDCAPARPHELVVTASRRVEVLPQPRAGLVSCFESPQESVDVLAVARSALPASFEFRATTRVGIAVEQHEPTTPQAAMQWVNDDPAPAPTTLRGRAKRPGVGEGVLARLNDGTPVWIVTHEDGSPSALVATPELGPRLPCEPAGARVLIRFDPSSRSFEEQWDEYGNHYSALGADLERYEVAVDPADPSQLLLGGRTRATRRSIAVPVAGPLTYTPSVAPAGEPLPLAEALSAAPESVVLIDAQLMVTAKGARLCPPSGSNDPTLCATDAAVVVDVAPMTAPGIVFTLGPPLLARRATRGFSEVTYIEKFSCGFNAAAGTPKRGRRSASSTSEIGAYAALAVERGGHVYAGGELRLGLRYRYEVIRERRTLDDVFEGLVGNNIGASLRMRFVTGSVAGAPETVGLLSVAPRIDISKRSLTLPSLVTPLLPELGLAWSSRRGADVFVSFSAPLQFDYYYEIIPSLSWFENGDAWLMLSLGGTLR